jgi:hypothetical protein
MSNIIVWDIETVPDIEGFAAANGLAGHGTPKMQLISAMSSRRSVSKARPRFTNYAA